MIESEKSMNQEELEKEISRFRTIFQDECDPRVINEVARHFAQWGAEHLADARKTSPKDLEEAADNHIRNVVDTAGHPGWDWTTQDIAEAFIAGAKWQYQKDRGKFAQIKAKTWCEGFDACKEQMMKEAVEAEITKDNRSNNVIRVGLLNNGFEIGDKVRVIVLKKED